ncbi:ras-induced vulval development antagonist-domain-containing protein [Crucibulum laeve]|uniref:Ras-induced vulval development antagonist-domain-containing protein n=1 Tax=Crucibulum laeve TaxID=68775 RepID=A0A5C3LXB2_9AGAR|nr:ras-induced vulval development antagonist-domain-containing protein [Crucibulum laeve]
MATIHPSRMALIPENMRKPESDSRHNRSVSPRRNRRSPSPSRNQDRHRGRDERAEGGRNDRRERDDRIQEIDDRGRERDVNRSEKGRGRERESGREGRSRDSHRDSGTRRASPQYEDYKRPAPSTQSEVPWRQPENMYPSRGGGVPHAGGSYGGGGGYGGGGADFMESRRIQRENATVNIWPPSPKAPTRGLSPKRSKSSKKSKRARSLTPSDTSSDEDHRRRGRKEKKRAKKDKDREDRSVRKHRERSYGDHSEDDRKHRSKRSKSKTHSESRRSKSKSVRACSPSRTPTPIFDEEELWVEKPTMAPPPVPVHAANSTSKAPTQVSSLQHPDSDSDSDEVGPQPLHRPSSKRTDERAYGGALLRGEGSAMAAFLQDGTEARIPRRGEIGLTPEEIAKYEDSGYVMSGSRHRRMNAVRMRKENQVISAEEKRGILKLQREERERREAILREEFGELVNERLKASNTQSPAKP